MTQLVSDIRILDNLLALNLNVSLWSARRKMSQEDLGGCGTAPRRSGFSGLKAHCRPGKPQGVRHTQSPRLQLP